MNLASISLAYLRARSWSTVLVIVLLACAVAAITALLLTAGQLDERVHLDARGIDLVVASKGSPLQIVLSSVYQLDAPSAAFPWSEAREIAARVGMAKTIPLSVMDNYRGVRVVGTTADYPAHYSARLREGTLWKKPLDAVIGADVARRTALHVGSGFEVQHGVEESKRELHERPYRVVGLLWATGTVVDHLILTGLESVWILHTTAADPAALVDEPRTDEGRNVTAVLITHAAPGLNASIEQEISANGLQTASPQVETARLFGVTIVGMRVLRGFALILVLAAGISVFIALYGALAERRYDLAIMRALGASPMQLMLLLLFEGAFLAAMGAVLGVMLGHLLTSIVGFALRFQQVRVTGWIWNATEPWVVAGAIAVGVLAALLPAWRAHETDIGRTLARG